MQRRQGVSGVMPHPFEFDFPPRHLDIKPDDVGTDKRCVTVWAGEPWRK
jgi:hypothetical protein